MRKKMTKKKTKKKYTKKKTNIKWMPLQKCYSKNAIQYLKTTTTSQILITDKQFKQQ